MGIQGGLLTLANQAIAAIVGENRLADWMRKVSAAVDGATTSDGVPLPTTSFVAPGGNDATAIRGDIEHPFLTIGAAVAAMVDGDAILVSPGTYAEAVVLPAAKSGSLFGLSAATTTINGGTSSAISWAPTSGANVQRSWQIENLTTVSSQGAPSITMDGTAVAGFAQATIAQVNAVGMTIGQMNGVSIDECQILGGGLFGAGSFLVQHCQNVAVRATDMRAAGVVRLVYVASAQGAKPRGVYTFDDTIMSGTGLTSVVIQGHPVIRMAGECVVLRPADGSQSISLSGTSNSAPDLAPDIQCSARCEGDVNLSWTATGNTAVNRADFSRAELLGNFFAGNSDGPNATRSLVVAQAARFNGLIKAGDGTDIDMRSSGYNSINISSVAPATADGAVNRSNDVISGAGGGVLTFGVKYPATASAGMKGFPNADTGGVTVNVTAISNTSVTTAVSGASTVEVLINPTSA